MESRSGHLDSTLDTDTSPGRSSLSFSVGAKCFMNIPTVRTQSEWRLGIPSYARSCIAEAKVVERCEGGKVESGDSSLTIFHCSSTTSNNNWVI